MASSVAAQGSATKVFALCECFVGNNGVLTPEKHWVKKRCVGLGWLLIAGLLRILNPHVGNFQEGD